MKRVTSVLVMLITAVLMSSTIYVNDAAVGSNNGTSWTNAFTLLQPALDAAVSGDQIWVAEGTYKPTYDYGLGLGEQGNHFRLKNGVGIYGGFNGTETLLSQRNWVIYEVLLNGNIGLVETRTDNCFHVIYHPAGLNLDNSAILDGFIIEDGTAYVGGHLNGGGLYNDGSSPAFNNCTFRYNQASSGGGMFLNNCSPVFTSCNFISNISAAGCGGAAFVQVYSEPVFDLCYFSINQAYNGGAIYTDYYSEAIFYNTVFEYNSATKGGAINSYSAGSPTLINCTLKNNTATGYGGGIYCGNYSSLHVYNSIIWGNTAGTNGNEICCEAFSTTELDYSCYGNSANDVYNTSTFNVTNSITSDPMFQEFNYLGAKDVYGSSPCVDTGLNSYNPKLLDFSRNSRIYNGTIDMGAYEWRSPMLTNPTVFVNQNATGTGTGKNWDDACTSLQAALDLAGNFYHIWVAAGVYNPTYDYGLGLGSRGNHFRMKNWVSIYGGFIGTEYLLNQRNIVANQTILSGDIGTPLYAADNCYHVLFNPASLNLNNSAVLDGFTVRDGIADYSGEPHNQGAGIYNDHCAPVIRNCAISNNTARSGGGIYNYYSNAQIFDSDISNNTAQYGGGIYNYYTTGFGLFDSTVLWNYASFEAGGIINILSNGSTIVRTMIGLNSSAGYGGGILNSFSGTVFSNCLIVNNTSSLDGGAINENTSSTVLTNCTIANNSTQTIGGGIYAGNSTELLKNTTIWGNTSVTGGNEIYVNQSSTTTLSYSCYGNDSGDITDQDGDGFINASGNITANPRFVNPSVFDYRNFGFSPCVNTGNNTYNIESKDYGDRARIQNGTIDIGAYEWTSSHDPAESILYVNWSATGSNNGSSWANAFNQFQSALSTALPGDQIWVATGNYKPTYDYGLGIGDRGKHFRLINGVSIYGGFIGTETLLSQRNYMANHSVLCGDLGALVDNSDNSYHVFYHPDGLYLDNTAVLDGFFVRDGNADGAVPHGYGGGVHNNGSSPSILNTTINYNNASNGGGVYNENSSAKYNKCDISENTASVSGGGIFNNSSHLCDYTGSFINYNTAGYYGGGIYNYYTENTTARSFILSNTAVLGGGGICNDHSISVLSNNLIHSNACENEGGGIMNFESQTVITNCTVANNSTQAFGGGIYTISSSTDDLRNTIVWGNTSVKGGNEIYVDQYSTSTLNYSCYGNDTDDIYDQDGNGFDASNKNKTDNPRFINPSLWNFRIYGFSPCFDAGDSGYNIETYDVGLRGRIQNYNIDMGAYEWTDGVDPSNINAPSGITITVNGSGQRELNWQSVYEALEYVVYRSELPYEGFSKLTTSVSNQYIDTEVLPGRKYFYYVKAESGAK